MERLLIFDFDGVLADSLAPMLSYAAQVCSELGYPCHPTKQDLEVLEKMEFAEYGRQLGIPEHLIAEFVARNFKLFANRIEPLNITPEIKSVIEQLSQANTLTIITGNSCSVVEKFLENHGIKDKFRKVLAAEDEGNRVEKIHKMVLFQGGSISEGFLIGDAVSDIRSARNAGVKSIAVSWGHQSKVKLLTENPDFLIDRPEELLTLFSDELPGK